MLVEAFSDSGGGSGQAVPIGPSWRVSRPLAATLLSAAKRQIQFAGRQIICLAANYFGPAPTRSPYKHVKSAELR